MQPDPSGTERGKPQHAVGANHLGSEAQPPPRTKGLFTQTLQIGVPRQALGPNLWRIWDTANCPLQISLKHLESKDGAWWYLRAFVSSPGELEGEVGQAAPEAPGTALRC